jgi:DUF2892 family protein
MANDALYRQEVATNVSTDERIASAIAGATLLLPAFARASRGRVALAVAGMALLLRGLTGYCGLYRALGVSSAQPAIGAKPPLPRDLVSQASEDSFPASDPPSWTPVNGPAAPPR